MYASLKVNDFINRTFLYTDIQMSNKKFEGPWIMCINMCHLLNEMYFYSSDYCEPHERPSSEIDQRSQWLKRESAGERADREGPQQNYCKLWNVRTSTKLL